MAKSPPNDPDPDPEMTDIDDMRRLEGGSPAGKAPLPRAILIGAAVVLIILLAIWLLYR